jgi:peptide subunit release factor 1 (eRF1)
MKTPRQKPIPVTSEERAVLEERKRLWEQHTGKRGDWGDFLETMTLLGLAAGGVHPLAQARSRSRNSVDVECPSCEKKFVMAVAEQLGWAVLISCPHCTQEMVVALRTALH